jgi:hypothetical protein
MHAAFHQGARLTFATQGDALLRSVLIVGSVDNGCRPEVSLDSVGERADLSLRTNEDRLDETLFSCVERPSECNVRQGRGDGHRDGAERAAALKKPIEQLKVRASWSDHGVSVST